MDRRLIETILKKVEKPARYIGGEKNSIVKDFDNTDLRFVFCFPDVYEIGMSHLGMHILYYLINNEKNMLCERAFAPWTDMGEILKEEKVELFSLENKRPLKDFDIVGFTMLYEMSYTNILYMMDLADIPFRSKDRDEGDPLIIAGGPTAYNPEAMADFIDLFIIGEGEKINIDLFNLYSQHKKNGSSKIDFLKEAARLDGIYVPQFFNVKYKDDGTISTYEKKYDFLPDRIKKVYVSDFDETFELERLIVPYLEVVHNRNTVELFRGCTQGCRFCQAGYIYRPLREKSVGQIMDTVDQQFENTGYNELSLSSLSSCDYSNLEILVDQLLDRYEDKKIKVSLPSLRVDSLSIDILEKIERVKKTGLTLAPEAGSQRMRDIINKGISEEDYTNALSTAFASGWSKIKLYFMLGLPYENESDLDGIVDMAYEAVDMFFARPKEEMKGNFQLTVSVSCFVPKAFTPFQWLKQNTIDEFYEKIFYTKDQISNPKINFQYHDPKISVIEGYLSRGDRKISKTIELAYLNGAKFDGWSEKFDYEIWDKSMNESGMTMDMYNFREKSDDEIFPWDIIDPLVSKDYLLKERYKSQEGILTRDCRQGCNNCGIVNCEMNQ